LSGATKAMDKRFDKQEAKRKDKVSSISQLREANKRIHQKHDESTQDTHIYKAKQIMQDTCSDLGLHSYVAVKAHVLFCKVVRSMKKLPRVNEVIAACLFYALPPKPKVYPKGKKRNTGPYNDTKKKRLKYTKF
jgi:transcription initiation factor TFIIIB Brf1 subunit/transcription initiation factor TFIIB